MLARITLTLKNGKLRGKTYAFSCPCTCHIGRAMDCAIRLPQETVSRHHCVLYMNPPTIQVRDSGSCNGTYLNGMQIGRPAEWHEDTYRDRGDDIRNLLNALRRDPLTKPSSPDSL